MDKENKFISLVVYLHNNESEVDKFLDEVVPAIAQRFAHFELVCVDDACSDNTIERISQNVSSNNLGAMVNIVHMSYYQGLESSMNAGRDLAIGDFVYEFDSCVVDYDLSVLDKMYETLLGGYDIVSANAAGNSGMASRLFYKIYNDFSREKSGKIGSETMRIISRRAINRVKALGVYIPYRKAVYSNCGLKVTGISYDCKFKKKKKSMTSERFSLALDSFVYFTNALERLSAILSAVFLVATIAIGVFALADLVAGHNTADGWLSIMGFLAIGFFGVFLLLTVVLKYLSTLLNLIFRQQRYVVADIEKITPKEMAKND